MADGGIPELAEVYLFATLNVNNVQTPVVIASYYGNPHQHLCEASSRTCLSVEFFKDADVRVVPLKLIDSVVMTAPDKRFGTVYPADRTNRWLLMERPGLRICVSSMFEKTESIDEF